MKNRSKLIAVAYDLNFRHAAEIFSGVSDYARSEGLDWQLLPLNFGFESKLMELASSGRLDGAIGTFVSDPWIEGLLAHRVAAVNLFSFSKILSAPSITLDDESIGRTAAQHLLDQGAKSLTFIGQDEAYFNRIRRESFIESSPPGYYQSNEHTATRRLQIERLMNYSAPVGIFCSSDRTARELCHEASLLGLTIGKDLLILGIGNEPAESTFAGIGLSSFDIPAREIGLRAASALDRHLESGSDSEPAKLTARLSPKLIIRESTLPSEQARLAERVITTITESVSRADFDIAELCRNIGVSRRAIELTTRKQLNKSPYQILKEQRLQKAKELLLTTNQTIMKIGEACGYPEQHHFSAWFKKQTGLSPSRYRKAD